MTDTARATEGLILHLQRLSTEDGPGIRTTVFTKGCPLRCRWCHNPESISPRPQVQWIEIRCIGCLTCVQTCPRGCLEMTDSGITIDRDRCLGCGACAEACPANAMELLGTPIGVEALVRELVKDRTYYQTSGGGVTVSGGEPTVQPAFVAALLARLQDLGIHTALDTCGVCSADCLRAILPHTDLVLFDLKEIDPDRHRAFTGQSNRRVLENLLFVRDALSGQTGHRLWIRTPLIPGATATIENVSGIGAFLARHLDGVIDRWELCAFNNLCRNKYTRLGLSWSLADTPLMRQAEVQALADCARASGIDPGLVLATGATRDG